MNHDLFPKSYQDSRERFRSWEKKIAQLWPKTNLLAFPVGDPSDDLSIDALQSFPTENMERLLLFTTGLHGIEGYMGSAMMELLLQNFLSQIDSRTTGLCLVHIINPWGMKKEQRTNQNNVDLNRNFIYDWQSFQTDNKSYKNFASFFAPKKPVQSRYFEYWRFYARLVSILLQGKKSMFKDALLSGQYEYPQGLYYGGKEEQEETQIMSKLFRNCFSLCRRIVHIDIHTGYGPRYQMSIVHSPFAGIPSMEYAKESGYPRVVCATQAEFYTMQGDMIDFLYFLKKHEFPNHDLYGACFEFGCFGDGIFDEAKALRSLILNNQKRNFGASKDTNMVYNLWREAFFPSEYEWKQKAIQDFELAFSCIRLVHIHVPA